MKWKFEKDTVIEKSPASIKRKLIIGVLFIGVFLADDWQQQRLATLRYGYNCMDQCKYKEATVVFEEYLNVDSDIYWYLLELVNDKTCSRKTVNVRLEKCMEQQKTYPLGE